jgi:hypothetical protein
MGWNLGTAESRGFRAFPRSLMANWEGLQASWDPNQREVVNCCPIQLSHRGPNRGLWKINLKGLRSNSRAFNKLMRWMQDTHTSKILKKVGLCGSSSIQAWGFFNMYAQSKCIRCSSRSHPNKNLKIASHLVLEPWHSGTGLPLSPGVAWFDPTTILSSKKGAKNQQIQ